MSGFRPWDMDPDYERFTGTPFTARLYDWTLRRYVKVRGIKLGKPDGVRARTGDEELQPERLYNDAKREPIGPQIVALLREQGPMTARQIAAGLGTPDNQAVWDWVGRNKAVLEVVGQVQDPTNPRARMKIYRLVDGYEDLLNKPKGPPATIIGIIRELLRVHGPLSADAMHEMTGRDRSHISKTARNYPSEIRMVGREPVPGSPGVRRTLWGLVGIHDKQEAGDG